MSYNLSDFQELRNQLKNALRDQSGEPISCRLYGASAAQGSLSITSESGDLVDFHIAEACNIASIINSLERILSLPRSSVACNELSEILLLTLDVLRENIRAASVSDHYQETDADKKVRSWAGFIKHPKDYVFAHRCLADIYPSTDPPTVVIDSNFLEKWSGLKHREKDLKKHELANRIVAVKMLSVSDLSNFFESCAEHISKMLSPPVQSD